MGIKYRVKELSEAQGINRSQMSRRADLSMVAVNDIWESRRDVKISTLYAIAQVLGVKVTDLIQEVEEDGALSGTLQNKIDARELVVV